MTREPTPPSDPRPPASTASAGARSRRERGLRARVEPWLDRWSELRFDSPTQPTPRQSPPPRARLGRGLAAAALVVLVLLLARRPLSDWLWPQTSAQQLRADAALALAQGRLTSADGRGARELFEAALARDPDRGDARTGLAQVGLAAIEQARRAIDERRYADAHRALQLARELSVPRALADAVASTLREREAADAGIERLLADARAARVAGRLEGDDGGALALYQRVIALQPNRTEALEGREDVLAELLQQARQWLAGGKLAEAAAAIHRVQAADAGHVDLPDALAQLAQQAEQRRRRADADLRRGRLPRALAGYRLVLAADPEDADAARGLVRVANAYAARSEQLAADFRFAPAEAALREAQAIAADAPAIREARRHLDRARQSQARAGASLPTPERQRRLRALLEQAAAAEARGDLLSPPGDSAFDKLRAARAIAPQDPRVRRAVARLLPTAKDCFETQLRGNRLVRARECLDVRRVLEGESPALAENRRRLAQRWIAVGNERLGAGELAVAQAALAAARALDPAAAGLDEFNERLRAASAGD
ncbi:hypothetical protein ACFQZQ_12020 [Lysobacter koreensis]|uniref:Tetratricopeptide repeat protein n=1 Tax=Lysobacter koreensis TaxID=266122 RepID=A0ABW2YPC6_9GAMM